MQPIHTIGDFRLWKSAGHSRQTCPVRRDQRFEEVANHVHTARVADGFVDDEPDGFLAMAKGRLDPHQLVIAVAEDARQDTQPASGFHGQQLRLHGIDRQRSAADLGPSAQCLRQGKERLRVAPGDEAAAGDR